MTYQELNRFCKSLTATTYVMQWGKSHVWKVGGKVFAIGGWQESDTPAFTFKTCELDFDFLKNTARYRPAPYFANRGMKWIQQFDGTPEMDDELKYYLTQSHKLVSLGLTKTKQKELGLNQN